MAGRRPIPSRQSRWAQQGARWLAEAGVSPNQISVASVAIAALGAAALVCSRELDGGARYALLLAAATAVPLRLLCNLFDGMVAVEFGKKSKAGLVYNELPDRLADSLFLVGAGYAVTEFDWAPIVGWSAAVFALLTAYVRTLGAAAGVSEDFSGPFAKQQRMAVLAAACLFTPLEDALGGRDYLLIAALLLIAAGSAYTVARRTWRLVRALEAG